MRASSPAYLSWRSIAARAAAALGDRVRGLDLVDEELALARDCDSRRAVGIALATRGGILGGVAGIEVLRQSTLALEHSGAGLELARAQLALGMALRRASRRTDAREPLRRALDLAHRCGAKTLAETALAELRAAGARPRRQRAWGLEGLTTRELQVAELAAAGLGNSEIAQRLFITPKTVETHMGSIFRKLGTKARGERAAALNTAS
jgi:DNA-binding CsgD family transcriptional regulator